MMLERCRKKQINRTQKKKEIVKLKINVQQWRFCLFLYNFARKDYVF